MEPLQHVEFAEVDKVYSLDRGVHLLASLGYPGRRRVVLGHTLNTLGHKITKQRHNVLSKFMVLCWAAFTAVLGHMRPSGSRRPRNLASFICMSKG